MRYETRLFPYEIPIYNEMTRKDDPKSFEPERRSDSWASRLADVDLAGLGEGGGSAEKVGSGVEGADGEVGVTGAARVTVKVRLGALEEVGRLVGGGAGETELGDPDLLARELGLGILVVGLEGFETGGGRAIPVDVDVVELGLGALLDELGEVAETLALVLAGGDGRTDDGGLAREVVHVSLPGVAESRDTEVGLRRNVGLVEAKEDLGTSIDGSLSLLLPVTSVGKSAEGGDEVGGHAANVTLGVGLPVPGETEVALASEGLAVGGAIPAVGKTTLTTRVTGGGSAGGRGGSGRWLGGGSRSGAGDSLDRRSGGVVSRGGRSGLLRGGRGGEDERRGGLVATLGGRSDGSSGAGGLLSSRSRRLGDLVSWCGRRSLRSGRRGRGRGTTSGDGDGDAVGLGDVDDLSASRLSGCGHILDLDIGGRGRVGVLGHVDGASGGRGDGVVGLGHGGLLASGAAGLSGALGNSAGGGDVVAIAPAAGGVCVASGSSRGSEVLVAVAMAVLGNSGGSANEGEDRELHVGRHGDTELLRCDCKVANRQEREFAASSARGVRADQG